MFRSLAPRYACFGSNTASGEKTFWTECFLRVVVYFLFLNYPFFLKKKKPKKKTACSLDFHFLNALVSAYRQINSLTNNSENKCLINQAPRLYLMNIGPMS